jgi:hypothetical protein
MLPQECLPHIENQSKEKSDRDIRETQVYAARINFGGRFLAEEDDVIVARYERCQRNQQYRNDAKFHCSLPTSTISAH